MATSEKSTIDALQKIPWTLTWSLLTAIESYKAIYGQCSYRSRDHRCSVKKAALKNFAKFTEKHLCQILFLNRVAVIRPAIFFQRRLWHESFPVNFAKFLRMPFLQNTSGRLIPFLLYKNLSIDLP